MEILTSKCFLFGVSISMTAIIAEKIQNPATTIMYCFLQYSMPSYPHEPVTKPFALYQAGLREQVSGCKKKKKIVGQPSELG